MRGRSSPSRSTLERIAGRRPVLEVLRAGRRRVHRLWIERGKEDSPAVEAIRREARRKGISAEIASHEAMVEWPERHGGVLAEVEPYPYAGLDEIVMKITNSSRPALVLVLDVLQDPQNLGSLLRTAEAVGVDGILLPARRGAEVTPAVVRVSAGACEHLLIAQGNLVQALEKLKSLGVWGVGLDSDPSLPPLRSVDLGLPLALVVGNEGEGMRRLVRQACDWVVRLPVEGSLDSLNASAAGSIALYAAWEARSGAVRALERGERGSALV